MALYTAACLLAFSSGRCRCARQCSAFATFHSANSRLAHFLWMFLPDLKGISSVGGLPQRRQMPFASLRDGRDDSTLSHKAHSQRSGSRRCLNLVLPQMHGSVGLGKPAIIVSEKGVGRQDLPSVCWRNTGGPPIGDDGFYNPITSWRPLSLSNTTHHPLSTFCRILS